MVDINDAYDRGHLAGEMAARLAAHDQHFETINGNLADVAHELHAMTLAVQRLGDEAKANAATVITTAAALKAADDARRTKSEQGWSPVAKLFATFGALASLAAVVGLYLTLKGK